MYKSIIALTMSFIGGFAYAQTAAVSTAPVAPAGTLSAAAPATPAQTQQAHYQVELLYSSYVQNEPGAFKSSGALAGFALGGEYDIRHSNQMILWGIDYYTGTPDNEAHSSSGAGQNTTTTTQTADTDFYTFGVSWATRQHLGESRFSLQESLGTDYRYLEFKARGGRSAQQEQIFLYAPLGLSLAWKASDKWQLRAEAEEDFLVSGTSRQHLENINPKLPTLSMSENSGTGTKFSFGARKKGQELDLMGEVYYRNWQIASSSTQDYVDAKGKQKAGVTPANSTDMVGLGIGVTY